MAPRASQPETSRYAISAFPLDGAAAGGLKSALLAASTEDRVLTVLSPDLRDFSIGNISVAHGETGTMPEELWRLWFGAGYCQIMFPEAHTAQGLPPEALRALYRYDERDSQYEIGSLERMIEFVEVRGPGPQAGAEFCARFDKKIADLPPGSRMHWQSFFFEPGINKHADALRHRGVRQTFHLHEALPDSLHLSVWGRSLLQAMSKVDVVYLHTDDFVDRLHLQLELLGLPVPEIRRFDLGIDRERVKESLARISASNFETAIPNYEGLNEEQREFVREVFQSQAQVPHRFISIDRVDPVKGSSVVLFAVEDFLDRELARFGSMAELQREYRFFFIHNLNDATPHPFDMFQLHEEYYLKEFQRVAAKFPGVIFQSQTFAGEHRIVVPALLKGCHGMTGGITEGLSLAAMEVAKASEEDDSTIIVGSGAGFARQVARDGLSGSAYFPQAGSVVEFGEALQSAVAEKKRHPGRLRERKKQLVLRAIDTRTDTIIPQD